MNAWEVKSCRGCLLQDNVSAMYDLSVPDVERIFSECTDTVIEVVNEADDVPQFLCNMCYRICELWLGFRERCQENQKKFKRVTKTKKIVARGSGETDTRKRIIKTTKIEHVYEDPLVEETSFNDAGTYWEDTNDDEDTVPTETFYEPPRKKSTSHHKTNKIPDDVKRRAILGHEIKFGPGPNQRGVWLHYLRSENKYHVKCKHCNKVLNTTNGSTGNLWNHLSKHGVTKQEQDSFRANESSFMGKLELQELDESQEPEEIVCEDVIDDKISGS